MSRAVEPGQRAPLFSNYLSFHGALLLELGRAAEAERVLAESVELFAAAEGQGGHRIHVARARRAEALAALGRFPEAVDLYALALPPLAGTQFGWSSPNFSRWQLDAARAAVEAGRGREARAALDELERRFVSHPDEATPELRAGVERLRARLG